MGSNSLEPLVYAMYLSRLSKSADSYRFSSCRRTRKIDRQAPPERRLETTGRQGAECKTFVHIAYELRARSECFLERSYFQFHGPGTGVLMCQVPVGLGDCCGL